VSKGRYTHGHKSRRKQTATYRSWSSMLTRCLNSKSDNYKHYGGRGITICDRWRNFADFLADMGERPLGTSLDRIDPNGNYEPDNARWWPQSAQSQNTRRTLAAHVVSEIRRRVAGGESQTAVAKSFGIKQPVVSRIIIGQAYVGFGE